ncbi:hypothetical protein [Micromonospora echinofusca]|uniref:PE family protein n=1 Tax=Micromonospora echinofusca TaxID=47858 RepID=A0ABS3VWV5_MICEH|nr:hypothetical protein [Micromonospora echinofusca]MBO4209020.1 hypothetical protein [Micromonospora echinofusca]
MVTTVNDAEIKALAGRLSELAKPLNDYLALLPGKALLPGEFAEGEDLRILFDSRNRSLVDGLRATSQAIQDIHLRLTEISQKYQATEDDNTVTAADLEGLIKQVKEDLPGIQL